MSIICLKVDNAGRIEAASIEYPESITGPNAIQAEAPENFAFENADDWRLDGGVLVYDPLPVPPPPPDPVAELQAEVADLTLALAELIGTGGGV